MRPLPLVLLPSLLLVCSACGQPRPAASDEPAAEVPEQAAAVVYDSEAAVIEAGFVRPDGLPRGSTFVSQYDERGAASHGYINDDRPVGFWTYVYANGQVSMQGTYLYGGVQDGKWSLWHRNGRKLAEGSYDRGQRHGLWQQWHDNGRLSTRGEYILGRRFGPWQSWWPNGRRQSQGNFVDGRPSGRWMMWDIDGRETRIHTHSHPDGSFPEDMSPPVIQWDGFPRQHQDRVAPFRPGGSDS